MFRKHIYEMMYPNRKFTNSFYRTLFLECERCLYCSDINNKDISLRKKLSYGILCRYNFCNLFLTIVYEIFEASILRLRYCDIEKSELYFFSRFPDDMLCFFSIDVDLSNPSEYDIKLRVFESVELLYISSSLGKTYFFGVYQYAIELFFTEYVFCIFSLMIGVRYTEVYFSKWIVCYDLITGDSECFFEFCKYLSYIVSKS